MTPKEKAQELINRFMDEIPANCETDFQKFSKIDLNASKRCALIAVDEIIETLDGVYYLLQIEFIKPSYWHEVKKEIEQL